MEEPIGAVFSPREPLSPQVAAEFARTRSLFVQGFLDYDWYKTTDPVARVDGDRIQLLRYYRYRVGKTYEKIPRRFRLLNLLCELDSPGEWYFDRDSGVLCLWPPQPITPDTTVSVWRTPTLIHLKGASHVVIRGLTLESTQREPIIIEGGSDNLIAFVDPDALDFRFKQGYHLPKGFERIPFETIGLSRDGYRAALPERATYRAAVRKRFEGRPSCDAEARYDPDAINDMLYGGAPYPKSEVQ